MPLTVFDVKGVPGTRRERIEAAVVAAAEHVKAPYEGWIAADPFRGGVRLLITGAHGFQHEVGSAMDEEPAVITRIGRATLDD
jgi:hypothetical protein